MTRTEERLTDALDAAARAVRGDKLSPLPEDATAIRQRPRLGRRNLLAAVAAAAGVALIACFALVPALGHRSGPAIGTNGGAAPVVGVGGFPTGIAVDSANGTVYVSSGDDNELTLINASTCHAALGKLAGCARAGEVATHGTDPIGVAVDEQTHTIYAVNGASGTVAVINAATCSAADSAGCTASPALVNVGSEPEFLAVDSVTNTIYVANTSSGSVSVIDGSTCNATDTAGCASAPPTVQVGAGAFPIAVDAATDTVYVGVNQGLAVIDGSDCRAGDVTGCSAKPAVVPLSGLAGIAIDDSAGTVYASSESGTVAVIDRDTCDAQVTTGCGRPLASVTVGSDPRGDAFDQATGTVYVTNAGSDTVSLINTAACSASDVSGCAGTPFSFPVGLSPRRVAVDPATGTVFVVNVGASTVAVIDGQSCNATMTRGCPKKAPLGTRQLAIAGGAGMRSNCSPAVVASASGGPAAEYTAAATQVASGTVAGRSWSLWVKKGASEPGALENGGLVLAGRWYGMCAGYPNILETQFIDTGSQGIAYGYMALPGSLTVTMTPAQSLLSPRFVRLSGASFFIATLAKSACAYPSVVLHASTPSGSAMHQLGFGSCQPGRTVAITGSDGEWGPGQASASLPGLGLGGSGSTAGNGGLVTVQETCSPAQTDSASGGPAGAQTGSEVEVASGTVGGQAWSLWSSKGVSGVGGIEDGGMVLGGRWYGLCPGFPNPAEFELIDTGGAGIVYGYVANPGAYAIQLTGTGALPAPATTRVQGGTFFIGLLPASACDYPAIVLNATTSAVSDLHHLGFGSCQPNRLVAISESNGVW
ncbi:MAG TPA: hypothetical protein VEL03_05950 [Streptosporangiaceae bacterium]|nr:hypothetical protein [Streptosporangiaceae bacterium]